MVSRGITSAGQRSVWGLVAVSMILTLVVVGAPVRPVHAVASCPAGTGYGGELTTSSDRSISNGGNGCMIIVSSAGTDVLTYTGAVQKWTVPAGVTSITLHVIGAGGGAGLKSRGGSQGGNGGGGGYATGNLDVTPGGVYDVIVGGGGRYMCTSDAPQNLTMTERRNFSYGGGAAGFGGATWDCSWASGGGRTALRTDGGADDIITAGGGGGGGYALGHGGAGGGATGQNGSQYAKGSGGTQSAGGAGGVSEDGYPGIQYAGGPAGVNTGGASEGGGGGGGYYGGGGAGDNSGGGGGSSYVGTARGLQSGSTQAGNWRTPGAVPPTNSAVPTIAGTAKVGNTLTATTGTWSGATTKSFQWQSSPNNSTWTDIPGATEPTYVIGLTGYFRVVETGSNFFGSTSANSTATSLVYDTTLSALTVSTGTLTPSFSSGTFAYTVGVPYATTSIKVTATRTHASTTLTVDGSAVSSGVTSPSISLAVGANAIPVIATNTGVSTTTTITVTRAAATAPTAPTITSVTAGDRRLDVAFSTPSDDGGEPITDYEYSLNGGTWTAAGTTSSPVRISGLTNGTSYAVRMRAVSTVGGGAPSAPSAGTPLAPATTTTTSTTTTVAATTTAAATTTTTTTTTTGASSSSPATPSPAAATPTVTAAVTAGTTSTVMVSTTAARSPATTVASDSSVVTTTSTTTTTTTVSPGPGSDVPDLEPGQAFVSRNGEVGQFEISRSDNHVIVKSGPSIASLAVLDSVGGIIPLDSSGAMQLREDTNLVGVQVSGFRPDSDIETWLYSDPHRLGVATVDATGSFSGNYTVPAEIEAGRHRLVMTGTDSGGNRLTIAVGIVAGAQSRTSSGGRVLFVLVLLVAAVTGIFFPAALRRRRREKSTTG